MEQEWGLECLNDGNDGNGNGVDAIVYDYELFMLFQREKHDDDDDEAKEKEVVLKLKHNLCELHEKPIKNMCECVYAVWISMDEWIHRQNIQLQHTYCIHQIWVNEVQIKNISFTVYVTSKSANKIRVKGCIVFKIS